MARSDKAPFRRSADVSSDGYFLQSEGFYVGDIRTLHMDLIDSNTNITYVLQGKVGREGVWQEISDAIITAKHFKNLDVSSYEYVRLKLLNVSSTVTVTIFGYEGAAIANEVSIKDSQAAINRDSALLDEVCSIKDEIKKIVIYMEEILGDKV